VNNKYADFGDCTARLNKNLRQLWRCSRREQSKYTHGDQQDTASISSNDHNVTKFQQKWVASVVFRDGFV